MKLVMVWVTECLFHVAFFSARRPQQLSGTPSEQRSYIICPPLAPHKEHAPPRHHRVAPDYFRIVFFLIVYIFVLFFANDLTIVHRLAYTLTA